MLHYGRVHQLISLLMDNLDNLKATAFQVASFGVVSDSALRCRTLPASLWPNECIVRSRWYVAAPHMVSKRSLHVVFTADKRQLSIRP